jgi:hypothetical protein
MVLPPEQGTSIPKPAKDPFMSKTKARWVEIQPFLLSVGYKLRPRYDPNWVPSWWNSTERRRDGELPEDGHQLYSVSCISCLPPARVDFEQRCDVLDAIRIEAGTKVVMKWIAKDSSEFRCIHTF